MGYDGQLVAADEVRDMPDPYIRFGPGYFEMGDMVFGEKPEEGTKGENEQMVEYLLWLVGELEMCKEDTREVQKIIGWLPMTWTNSWAARLALRDLCIKVQAGLKAEWLGWESDEDSRD
jgi:hypothetical protein